MSLSKTIISEVQYYVLLYKYKSIKNTVLDWNSMGLVVLKSTCFEKHTLLPRDLEARGLKSMRSADFIKETVPRKSAWDFDLGC
jgi:hypothetical protein